MNIQEISSTIESMRFQEDSGYVCTDYLQRRPNKKENHLIRWRGSMINWYYDVVTLCKFDCETVEIATSYLDRFLMTEEGLTAHNNEQAFRLAALTCLYIAIKIHEFACLGVESISNLGGFTVKQVECMEMKLLKALKWRVNPPTANSFVRQFLETLPLNVMSRKAKFAVHDLCKHQIKSAVKDSGLIDTKKSIIAVASIMNSWSLISEIKSDQYHKTGRLLSEAASIDHLGKESISVQKRLSSVLMRDQPENLDPNMPKSPRTILGN